MTIGKIIVWLIIGALSGTLAPVPVPGYAINDSGVVAIVLKRLDSTRGIYLAGSTDH